VKKDEIQKIKDSPARVARAGGGFGVIEIVVVVAVAAAALVGFLQVGVAALRLLKADRSSLEATLLAREGLDATRSARDESWANIASLTASQSPSARYYPVVQNGKWVLAVSSPGLINGMYDRYIQVERVARNGYDDIVLSGGTDDSGTRKVTAHASSTAGDVVVSTYLTNFQSYLTPSADAVSVSYTSAATDGAISGFSFPSQNAGDGDPAQSFTTGSDIRVTRISAYMRRATTAPSDIYAQIRPTAAGAVLGTSQIVGGVTISTTSPAWVDFYFSPPVSLAAGTYTMRLRSIPDSATAGSGSAGSVYWQYTLQNPSGPYAGGTARKAVGYLGNPADQGQQLDQYDFGFKVYASQ
jgi:Tfp pilus assembly protein PilV